MLTRLLARTARGRAALLPSLNHLTAFVGRVSASVTRRLSLFIIELSGYAKLTRPTPLKI